MNALEREIEKGLEDAYKNAGQNAYFGNGFKAGANFILEKNLDERFAEWMMDNYLKHESAYISKELGSLPISGNISELKSYWLNNVYGK